MAADVQFGIPFIQSCVTRLVSEQALLQSASCHRTHKLRAAGDAELQSLHGWLFIILFWGYK